jgi:aminoglycoside phosphotransferase (APT) family kinase protein
MCANKLININRIAKQFLIDVFSIEVVNSSFLSSVYILNKKFVLRGRLLDGNVLGNISVFEKQLNAIKEKIDIETPVYNKSISGQIDVCSDEKIWNCYNILNGSTICNWWEMHSLSSQQKDQLFDVLEKIRMATIGEPTDTLYQPAYCFLTDFKKRFLLDANILSQSSRGYIQNTISAISELRSKAGPKNLAFVHGDFHSGNVLFCGGQVSGLIDLDWARIGFPEEDIAYLTMMLGRDLDGSLSVDIEKVRLSIENPRGKEIDRDRFKKYVTLFAVFDLMLFASNAESERGKYWYEYQKRYVDVLLKMYTK